MQSVMIIKNVKVFTEDKTFEPGAIGIENGIFKHNLFDSGEIIDGEGCYAIPGLIDVHFHGCMGYDFCDGTKEAIEKIAEYEASQGVTTIVPATMTLSEEELMKIMANGGTYENKEGAAVLAGINMEGPFICSKKKGAQAATHIHKPDVAMFRRLQEAANGLIRLVDIAPEVEGAMEFISVLKDEVHISFAHTTADYDTAKTGYALGACHATHLYNAMPPFTHREPGVIGAARDSEHCMVELICDGIHIHPSVVRATFQMFGNDRVVLVSDSMRACGLSDGDYTLGGQDVKVVGKLATLKSDGAIAGSVTNLMDCMRTAVKEMGIPLESAVAAATMNPAKSVGLYEQYGSITEGKIANVVLLNEELNIKKIIING